MNNKQFNNTKFITSLSYFINTKLDKINNDVFHRKRKISFSMLFYFITKYNSSYDSTYDSIYNDIVIDKHIVNVSKNAFNKKRMDIKSQSFLDLNNSFLGFFYKQIPIVKYRIVSVDGSQMNFLFSLHLHMNSNKHNTYTYGTLSCLFDVDNQIPINYELSKSHNEQEIFIKQMSYLNKNDIVVADRGYYSNNVINSLITNKINFVIRLKKSSISVKELNLNTKSNSHTITYTYNEIDYEFKIYKYSHMLETFTNDDFTKIEQQLNKTKKDAKKIKRSIERSNKKYIQNKETINSINKKINKSIDDKQLKKELKEENIKIKKLIDKKYVELNKMKYKLEELERKNDSIYYVITNLTNHTEKEIKEIYKKRWCVEVHFRFTKDKLKFRNMNSKNFDIIKQNLYTTQFIFILESYFEHFIKINLAINGNKKINKTSLLSSIHKYLLHLILIKKRSKKNTNKIISIFIIVTKNLITKITNNEYKERIIKRPTTSNKYKTISTIPT